MEAKKVILSTAVSLLSGFIATKIMGEVSMKLYKMEPQEARKQEDAVRPGPPYQMAAKKTESLLDIQLNDEQLKKAGMGFHFGLGMGWALFYPLLAENTNFSPVVNGLITGSSLSLLVDEGLTPALGFSAPNKDYLMITHVRAVANHLVYGLALAGIYELLYN